MSNPFLQRRQTDPSRFALGLVVADLVGAALVGVAFGFSNGVGSAIFAFIGALFIWAAGLIVLAMPIWLILNRLGVRSLLAAMVLGFILSGLPIAVIAIVDRLPGVSLAVALFSNPLPGLGLAIAGAAAALAGWLVAYRPDSNLSDTDEVFG